MSVTASSTEASFRQYLASASPFLEGIESQSATEHAEDVYKRFPAMQSLVAGWQDQLCEPFKGITVDGTARSNLFTKANDRIDIDAIVACAEELLAVLSDEQKALVLQGFSIRNRRLWQNTHIYFNLFRVGIRLEEADVEVRSRILRFLERTLSSEGYQKVRLVMEMNHFLGKLYNANGVLNRHSYNFVMFGTPSSTQPWAWALFGHHLCLNCFIHGLQIEIVPTFTGAEPNMIDQGHFAGSILCGPEQELGLRLMRSLPSPLRSEAQVKERLEKPINHKGPWTFHLGGAFRENAVLPTEGACLRTTDETIRFLVMELFEHFIIYLPLQARMRRLESIRNHLDDTWFIWIGQFETENPTFYYRLQSPVVVCEFEHCASIFLGNTEPERFHIHTIVHAPNAGDYGMALLDPPEA